LRQSLSSAGFTLIELLVVVAVIAISAATISLALRDPAAAQLAREGERLAALFETARAESRATGLEVRWVPVQDAGDDQFRFDGLPRQLALPRRWMGEPLAVELGGGARFIRLGPEPLIGAQRLQLSLGSQRIELMTDGLAPFEVGPPSAR
jgi:general secretion pathway protein H